MKSLGVLTGAAGLAAYLNADVVAKYAERVTDALQQRAAESLMKMLQMMKSIKLQSYQIVLNLLINCQTNMKQ